jgi:hypothetical protein
MIQLLPSLSLFYINSYWLDLKAEEALYVAPVKHMSWNEAGANIKKELRAVSKPAIKLGLLNYWKMLSGTTEAMLTLMSKQWTSVVVQLRHIGAAMAAQGAPKKKKKAKKPKKGHVPPKDKYEILVCPQLCLPSTDCLSHRYEIEFKIVNQMLLQALKKKKDEFVVQVEDWRGDMIKVCFLCLPSTVCPQLTGGGT